MISPENKLVITGAVRTPVGAIGGGLQKLQAYELATLAVKELLKVTEIDPELIDYTSIGWVMQDPRTPNLAKVVSEMAGIPPTVPGTTIHENCASGGASLHDIVRRIMVGDIEIGIAGGTESMSNVPRYLYEARMKGRLYGDFKLVDGVMGALTDVFVGEKGELMGYMTERLAEKYEVSREQQDEIAFRSHANALKSWSEGYFDDYVFPVEIPQRKKEPIIVNRDEGPKAITMEALQSQRPYFKPGDGTITAANSSTINDGAAMVLIMTEKKARELNQTPLAAVVGYHNIGVQREYMGEGAFQVIPPLVKKHDLNISDLDLLEINEAFAAVLGGAFNSLKELTPDKVNQWGSGISLGHPVGCTGARQIVDMVHQLKRRNKKLGLTSRCVGGGIGSGEILMSY